VSREILADAKTPGVVAHYMTRPPITPERMVGETSSAKVICRSVGKGDPLPSTSLCGLTGSKCLP